MGIDMEKVFKRVIVGITMLGMVFFMGCDTQEQPPPKPLPKVVSKKIKPPQQPAPKQPAEKTSLPEPQKKIETPIASVPQPKSPPVAETGGPKPPLPGPALPLTEDQVKLEKSLAKGNPSLFKTLKKYDTKNRVDPFIPLLEKKTPTSGGAAKPQRPRRILTPLEKMDLSQIKLVAIIEINKGFIAMVEEASGKGYEVKVGTYMGRRGGRVTAIKKDRLMIKEYYTDYQGKERERNQEIKFHKSEGGE